MTDDTPIPPALTPDQWATLQVQRCHEGDEILLSRAVSEDRQILSIYGERATDYDKPIAHWPMPMLAAIDASAFHATAALCLHEQTFGFTQQDVDTLREAAQDAANIHYEKGSDAAGDAIRDATLAVAAKISALLPPKEAGPPV